MTKKKPTAKKAASAKKAPSAKKPAPAKKKPASSAEAPTAETALPPSPADVVTAKHALPATDKAPVSRSEETLFENKFIAVRQYRGYSFLHMVRSDGKLVSVVPFARQADGTLRFLARIEICPAHADEPGRYSITGGVEHGHDWRDAAKLELLEEAGYTVDKGTFIDLGYIRQSKQEDTLVNVFAIDVTDVERGEAIGDGSYFEKSAWTEWVDRATALSMHDPLFIVGIVRLEEYLKNGH